MVCWMTSGTIRRAKLLAEWPAMMSFPCAIIALQPRRHSRGLPQHKHYCCIAQPAQTSRMSMSTRGGRSLVGVKANLARLSTLGFFRMGRAKPHCPARLKQSALALFHVEMTGWCNHSLPAEYCAGETSVDAWHYVAVFPALNVRLPRNASANPTPVHFIYC